MTYNVFGGTLNLTQSNPIQQSINDAMNESIKSKSHIVLKEPANTKVTQCSENVFLS